MINTDTVRQTWTMSLVVYDKYGHSKTNLDYVTGSLGETIYVNVMME